MEFTFQGDGILGEEESVNVESKRHRGAAEFVHSIDGFKSPRQADLDDVVPERAAVGDHVDVASPDVGRAVVVLGDGFIEVGVDRRPA